jgi:dTDP-4-dehydrorhamnose reductase
MKIFLFGATGLLGTPLRQLLDAYYGRALVYAPGRGEVDFADQDAAYNWVMRNVNENPGMTPDLVINLVAQTRIDECESPAESWWRWDRAAWLARAAQKKGARFIQFSSDMAADPINAYGRDKARLERALWKMDYGTVIRVANLFGPARPTFIDRYQREYATWEEMWQLFRPSYALDIAEAVVELIKEGIPEKNRVLSLSNSGPVVPRTAVANLVREPWNCGADDFWALPKAARPKRAVLESDRPIRSWVPALQDFIKSLHPDATCGIIGIQEEDLEGLDDLNVS